MRGHDINFLALPCVVKALAGDTQFPEHFPAPWEGRWLLLNGQAWRRTSRRCSDASSVPWYLQKTNFSQAQGDDAQDGVHPPRNPPRPLMGSSWPGAWEARIAELFLEGLGLDPSNLPKQLSLPRLKESLFADTFAQKTQAESCEIFGELDACVTPVLTLEDISQLLSNRMCSSFITDQQQVTAPVSVPFFPKTPACLFHRDCGPRRTLGRSTQKIWI